MKSIKLDQDEEDILEAFEAGEFQSKLTPSRKEMIEKSASETFKKDKRINIRISSRDLISIQRRALEEGMPYQTMISSILHKFISGSLYDVRANKNVHINSKNPG